MKSKRVASSRWAWSTALRTSWWSTSETTSNDGMARSLGAAGCIAGRSLCATIVRPGSVPEWPKGADCKSAGNAFDGSNPSRPTNGERPAQRGCNASLSGPRPGRSSAVNRPRLAVQLGHQRPSVCPASGRRALPLAQEALHDGHVEPAVELAADLALDADQLEPAARRAAPATPSPPASMRAMTAWKPLTRSRRRATCASRSAADAQAVVVAADVDRVLHRGAVRGPLLVGRQGGEADDLVVVRRRRRRRRRRSGPASQARWSARRAGHQVERGRRRSRPRGCRWPGWRRRRRGWPGAG